MWKRIEIENRKQVLRVACFLIGQGEMLLNKTKQENNAFCLLLWLDGEENHLKKHHLRQMAGSAKHLSENPRGFIKNAEIWVSPQAYWIWSSRIFLAKNLHFNKMRYVLYTH